MFGSKSNQDILNDMDSIVKGHLKAKKILINLVNRSKLAYYQIHGLERPEHHRSVKPINCMLVGKSGTGKTFLVETLQRVCHFPLYKIDATRLNPTGAEGGVKIDTLVKDIRKYAITLLEERPDIYFTPQGVLDQMVVFVDEIDKLGDGFGNNGWNQHVQANFLRLFENKVEGLHNLSFIFAGAFMDIHKRKPRHAPIGFSHTREDVQRHTHSLEEKIIDHGLIPELIGRVHHIVGLDELTKDDYKNILIDILIPNKEESLMFISGEQLDVSEDKLQEIIDIAFNSDQGVRMLSKLLEEYILDIEFNTCKYDRLF